MSDAVQSKEIVGRGVLACFAFAFVGWLRFFVFGWFGGFFPTSRALAEPW